LTLRPRAGSTRVWDFDVGYRWGKLRSDSGTYWAQRPVPGAIISELSAAVRDTSGL